MKFLPLSRRVAKVARRKTKNFKSGLHFLRAICSVRTAKHVFRCLLRMAFVANYSSARVDANLRAGPLGPTLKARRSEFVSDINVRSLQTTPPFARLRFASLR